MAVPMTALTKKNAKFIWRSECQERFEKLKQAFTSASVLAMPSGQEEYVLYTDALKLGRSSIRSEDFETLAVWGEVQDFHRSREFEVILHIERAEYETAQMLQKWRLREVSKGLRLYSAENGVVRYHDRLLVPSDDSLREDIMKEAQAPGTLFTPGVRRCVKVKHLKPAGNLRQLLIPEWKWENIKMDFGIGLSWTVGGYNVIWVIVDRTY
ncbi:uncharacterized protein LOC142519675 [Primulina tabacum]|uniref:uncharacterized protein LOC142519675 n=1 Tax=Primulina tabacum TaxID=48773 RepID=UPI003F59E43D